MNRQLQGKVFKGTGVASGSLDPLMAKIRERSGCPNLQRGTLNVRLADPYPGHTDFEFLAHEHAHHEDVKFERCRVAGIPALIMRTSTNFHGDSVLELMAESHLRSVLGVVDDDTVIIEVFD